ncbi:unnamed protein product [Lymnaea stagnalis]|uniref:Uncharacterized protein n=1 Tax=Lymnaea stagnalis TaxID=6523 RepID=A0AAV2IFP8_LYMST
MNVHIATKMLANLLGLFLAAFFISTTTCAPSGPTLNDLVSFHCPSDRPFKCLPYGACCRGSEFCYSGMCESCFPRGVEDGALLDWCREKGQFDVALMRNDGCRLACQDVFNTTQLIYGE